MTIDDIRIDWADELGQLEPFFHKGGLVCINGHEESAWHNFIKLVREAYKTAGATVVHFDEENPATYSPEDMLAQLRRSLGLETPKRQKSALSVLSHLEVGGDLEVGDVTVPDRVEIVNSSGFVELDDLKQIYKALDDRITRKQKTVIILSNCDVFQHAKWLWNEFWLDWLSPLVKKGMLFIRACETSGDKCPFHKAAPLADHKMCLPSEYSDKYRSVIIEEVAAHLVKFADEDPAKALDTASVLVTSGEYKPSVTYTNVIGYIYQRRRERWSPQ